MLLFIFSEVTGQGTATQYSLVTCAGYVDDLDGLDHADLKVTSEAKFQSGGEEEPITYTVPLRMTSFRRQAHLSIRNSEGQYIESLGPEQKDVLTDYAIPGLWLRSGLWTFTTEAVLLDGRYSFAYRIR
ncbi:hypothetical protein AB5N19_07615 [Seiridium cardinale]|uniref:Uncharacterized protein n=1 Tax=Seiridium cardinale TaxID=138064 RepID=A0ABR2XT96_9PEZI